MSLTASSGPAMTKPCECKCRSDCFNSSEERSPRCGSICIFHQGVRERIEKERFSCIVLRAVLLALLLVRELGMYVSRVLGESGSWVAAAAIVALAVRAVVVVGRGCWCWRGAGLVLLVGVCDVLACCCRSVAWRA